MQNEVIGTIKQKGTQLFSDTSDIAYQYASNLKLSVEFMDSFFDGYSLLWLFAHDKDSPKTGAMVYDAVEHTLTLPPEAFSKDGQLYISMRALKDDVVIPTSPVVFYITQTLNPNADNTPHEAGWEEIAKGLMEQVFDHEYKDFTDKLLSDTREWIDEIQRRLDNGDFVGQQGIQGIKGDTGDTGPQGPSGISVPTNGIFNFEVQDGHLFINYPDATSPPTASIVDGHLFIDY